MSWKFREPKRSDYDTDEEYEEAYDSYDIALTEYVERSRERRRNRRED